MRLEVNREIEKLINYKTVKHSEILTVISVVDELRERMLKALMKEKDSELKDKIYKIVHDSAIIVHDLENLYLKNNKLKNK